MRKVVSFALFAVLLAAPAANAKILSKSAGPGAVWVRVRDKAPYEDDKDAARKEALERAMRRALEEGGKIFIESQTKVENFETIHDRIFTYTEGIVTDVTVEKEGILDSEFYVVYIVCKVHTQDLVNKWQALRALVEKRGKPRIMVTISETINRRYSRSGTAQTLIQDELLKRRMPLVDERQMQSLKELELKEAQLDQNLSKIVQLAKQQNAEIVIVGTSEANYEGVRTTYGVNLHKYNAEVQVRAVKTSTGELMVSKRASVNASATERQKAEKDALAKAGKAVALDTVRQLVSMWFFEEDRGANIVVRINGIGYKPLKKMMDFLERNKKVKSAKRRSYKRKVAVVEVQTHLDVDALIDLIMDSGAAEFEVDETGASNIMLKVAGEDE